MTREEEEIRRKEIHQLLDLVLDINGLEDRKKSRTGDKPTAFFEFAGHVCSARIDIHETGWAADTNSDFDKTIYFTDGMYDKKELLSVAHYLNRLKSGLAANPS